jgi:hypothetical protein
LWQQGRCCRGTSDKIHKFHGSKKWLKLALALVGTSFTKMFIFFYIHVSEELYWMKYKQSKIPVCSEIQYNRRYYKITIICFSSMFSTYICVLHGSYCYCAPYFKILSKVQTMHLIYLHIAKLCCVTFLFVITNVQENLQQTRYIKCESISKLDIGLCK